MPRVIPVGYGEAAIHVVGGPGTAPYITTIGVALAGIDPDQYPLAADLVMDAYGDHFQSQTSNDCYIDKVVLSVGLSGGTSGSVDSTLPPKQGGNSGEMAPLSMAVVARKVSADLGRRGRGRCFIPCTLNRNDVDEGGNLVPGTLTSYVTRWNDFLLQLATNDPGLAMSPVLLHNDGGSPTVITGGSISAKVGWIRKRIR